MPCNTRFKCYLANVLKKPVFLLILALCCGWWPRCAQAQFGIAPTDSLVAEFPTDSLTRIFQIDFPNETSDSLGLSWRWIDGGWTEGWDVNLCDLGECYTGVPADADMLEMPAEGAGFLKLIVNALEVEGTCFLHFWVWPTGNQDALVHIYFDLRNGGVNTVGDPARVDQPLLYPNPVRQGECVTIPHSGVHSIRLDQPMQRWGGDGRLYSCIPTETASGWTLSTSGWSTGQHWIRWSVMHPPIRLIVE